MVVATTLAAVGVAWLGVSASHPTYVLAAVAFAAAPVGYGAAAMLRPSPGLPRGRLVAAAGVSIAVVAAGSFAVLTSCEQRLGPGADLSGCDLGSLDLHGRVLAAADLSDSDLSAADLSGADLTDADLSGAMLEGADLAQADLSGADLTDAVLLGAAIEGAVFDGVTLSGARLAGLDLSGADLAGASLAGADLSGGSLADANLSDANLAGAVLTGIDLARADVSGALLAGADLTGAVLRSADLSGADLAGARLVGADLSGAELADAHLTEADLTAATLAEARLEGADLSGALLDDADMRGALLRGAELVGAGLAGTDLSGADLGDADLAGSTLASATLGQTSLIGATGLEDPDLAASLGVDATELGAALADQGVRLEARENVLAALAAACRGQGVTAAAPFPQGSLHPIAVLGDAGEPVELTDRVPGAWEPMAVRFAQLVVCAEPETERVVEVCRYTVIGTGEAGETVRRVRFERTAMIVEAATGRVVDRRTFLGGEPRFCELEITPPFFEPVLRGSHVGFGRLRPWLAGFVE